MTPAILELSGDSVKYIYSEEDFSMMILSEPIPSQKKGSVLRAMDITKDIIYNDKRYISCDAKDKIKIKKGSNITYFGQSIYMLKDKNVHLIEPDERKDIQIDQDMTLEAEDVISCKTQLNTTYVIMKNNAKSGFAYIRTNINNLKIN